MTMYFCATCEQRIELLRAVCCGLTFRTWLGAENFAGEYISRRSRNWGSIFIAQRTVLCAIAVAVARFVGSATQRRSLLQLLQSSNRACLGMATAVSTLVHSGPAVYAGRHSLAVWQASNRTLCHRYGFQKPSSKTVAKSQHARDLAVSHSEL